MLRALEYLAVVLANSRDKRHPAYARYSSADLLVAHRLASLLDTADAVLDIGCGDGHRLREIQLFKNFRLHGVDLAPPPSTDDITLQTFDGQTLPFDDGEFDAAMICYVLHHLSSSHAASLLNEAMRVTRRKILVIEDSMQEFGLFYRLRNKFHRIEKDLAYSAVSTYRTVKSDGMFLTHERWREFLSGFERVQSVRIMSLSDITKYAHHTLFELELRR